MKNLKWKPILVLILVGLIVYFNLTWGWAILFLFWMIPDLFSGTTFLMEPVERAKNPILYWLILSIWGLLSIFILLDEFAPQVLPTEWNSSNAVAYQSHKEGDYVLDYNNLPTTSDTLLYKDFLSDEFNVVGISTQTTYNNDEIDFALKELWNAFEKKDISTVIPDIIEDKIYVIQSDFDKDKKGHFTLTIGYKTASLDNIHKELNGLKVRTSKYAVVEIEEQPLKNLRPTWEKIMLSDLPANNLNNIEVFHYDSNNKSIEKIDIWLSVPTSEDDFNKIKSRKKQIKSQPESSTEPISIKTKKINNPYQAFSPKETPIVSNTTIASPKNQPTTTAHSAITVVGLQKVVNHQDKKKINRAIQNLWESFFQKDYSKHIYNIIDYERLYLTYSNYSEHEVTLTLGYLTKDVHKFNKKKPLHALHIPSNDYYKFKLNNTLPNHDNAEWSILDEVIEYRAAESCDFEVYTFDKNYNITNSFLWIGAK